MGSEMCIRDRYREDAHISVTMHLVQDFVTNNILIVVTRSTRRHAMYRLTHFKLVCSKRPRHTRRTQKLGPRNPTSRSTRTKSAQGLATSQANKPPDEIVHIKYLCCLLMASRLFVFVSGGQGKCRCVSRNALWPDFVERRRPIHV